MIRIKSLSKSYDDLQVLQNISLTINDGEIYGLVGRSGAGKSTLLRCINGLEQFDSGDIEVNGIKVKSLSESDLREFRKNMGMIFQQAAILERKTVYENIVFPLKCWKIDKNIQKERVETLVKLVGLEDKMNTKVRTLSGGQKQRVAIARALALEPNFLLCDEATSALDPRTTQEILQLLSRINRQLNITIILVTHEMAVVKQVCTKVALLESGFIVEDGSSGEVFMSQPQSLRRLLGEEEVKLNSGTYVELLAVENTDSDTIISDLARDLNLQFIIVDGRVEHFRNLAFSRFTIKIQEKDLESVVEYLSRNKIEFKQYIVSKGAVV